jgi:hypothetical protein
MPGRLARIEFEDVPGGLAANVTYVNGMKTRHVVEFGEYTQDQRQEAVRHAVQARLLAAINHEAVKR